MKIISFLLMITVILFSTTAYSLKVVPENQIGKPGEEVGIQIKISQVNKPIEAFGTVFSYNPEILSYKGLTKLDLTKDFEFLEGYEYSPGFVKIAGISRIPIPEFAQGVLFSINFKVKNTAIPGGYAMTFADDITDGKTSNIYFTSKNDRVIGEINPSGLPPHIPGNELGYFIWYNPDNDTWHLRWSVNNKEDKGVLFTDDFKNAITQPAIFTVATSEGAKSDTNIDKEIRTFWGHTFSGFVKTDGEIFEFNQEGLEPSDVFEMDGTNRIVFEAMEDLFDDTLVFKTNGNSLTFELKIDGELLPHKIFIGAYRKNPESSIFTLSKPIISNLFYMKPSGIEIGQ